MGERSDVSDANPGPVGLAVKLPFATTAEFITKYGVNLTRGGIYLRSKVVKPVGTAVTIDLKLSSGERILYASAVVHFTTGQGGQGVTGMGLRFLTLDAASQKFLKKEVSALPHADSPNPPLPINVGPAVFAPEAVSPVIPEAPAAGEGSALDAGAQVQGPAFESSKVPPSRSGPIVGIDLGTTNSCVAHVKNGKPSVLSSREGYSTVPSILALNSRGKLVIGHPAKGQMLTNPRSTVYGAKRMVGRSFDSPVVQKIKDKFAYEVTRGEQGDAAVRLGGRVYSLQEVSALLLREVKEIAENQLGQPVCRAVITVPAYYTDPQRQAVREAGRLAGLYVERILNEPTAAALVYGYGKKLRQRVLVYDLGGGTFDASVLQLTDDIYEVLSTGGDTFLGGLDFDNAIVEELLRDFKEKTGKEFQGDRVAMQRITDAAERAKCALSERSAVRIQVPFVTVADGKALDLDYTLNREKLMELTDSLIDRTLETCQEVLLAKGLSPRDIDEVILVGGQSRYPRVHEKMTTFFGKTPSKSVHPDEAVALGAALLAYSLERAEGVTLIDVLPMSVGVGLPGGRFKPVLDRNLPLPAQKQYVISTSRDNQTELEVAIFQGDSDRAEANEHLSTLKLQNLPKGPKGSVKIEVTFAASSEGLVKVVARESSTGREVATTLSTNERPEAVPAKMAENSGSAPQSPPPEPAPAPRRTGLLDWLKRMF